MGNLSRRDFLKLAGISPVYFSLAKQLGRASLQSNKKNILVLVYDAWTAKNISLYGYERDTTPNLSRLAENASVYHNHNAASDFTSPGTASILTGTLPWTHRAINYAGTILDSRAERNIFHELDEHHSVAYSHNVLVNEILRQLLVDIDRYIPRHELMLVADWVEQIFLRDFDASSVSRYYIFDKENPFTNSLVLPDIVKSVSDWINKSKLRDVKPNFPLGLPEGSSSSSFTMESSHQWLIDNIGQFPEPFMGYFHFLPPHAPYYTRKDFVDRFDDNYRPVEKPNHFFKSDISSSDIPIWRKEYDEFVAYIDEEIGKLFDFMKNSGVLDNTVVFLTSDHGELFERGLVLHGKNVFYESIMKVPLMIFDPDLDGRRDIFQPTSAIDILPTALNKAEKEIPDWAEGKVMPPYEDNFANDRPVFSLAAIESQKEKKLDEGSYAMITGPHKVVYYEGFEELPEGKPYVEVFNIENDPDELENLAGKDPALRDRLLEELLLAKNQADSPFE